MADRLFKKCETANAIHLSPQFYEQIQLWRKEWGKLRIITLRNPFIFSGQSPSAILGISRCHAYFPLRVLLPSRMNRVIAIALNDYPKIPFRWSDDDTVKEFPHAEDSRLQALSPLFVRCDCTFPPCRADKFVRTTSITSQESLPIPWTKRSHDCPTSCRVKPTERGNSIRSWHIS